MADFNAPECPRCKKPLLAVDEVMYDGYAFNPETGRYDVLPQRADCDLKCSACGYFLPVDLFPEGVCNYEAEANAPCVKCGRTDKFLYTNMLCTECHDPEEEIQIRARVEAA